MKKLSKIIVVALAAWWVGNAALSVWYSNKKITEGIIRLNSEDYDEIVYLGSSLSFMKTFLNQDHDFILLFKFDEKRVEMRYRKKYFVPFTGAFFLGLGSANNEFIGSTETGIKK